MTCDTVALMDLRSALSKVNKRGMLLVYPINNKKEPASLWSELYPKSEMRWEWDAGGDDRVSQLWHMRERLSTSDRVIYAKWFRGRATLISFELFASMLKLLAGGEALLSFQARDILDLLREDSPLSTKALKKMTDLQGRENEKVYVRALKELWMRGLIVGYGEVDEGAFPSLAIGATQLLFEDVWNQGQTLNEEDARATVERLLPAGTPFRKYFDQVLKASTIAD